MMLYMEQMMEFPLVPEVREHFKELTNIFLIVRVFQSLQFSESNRLNLFLLAHMLDMT